MFDTRTRLLFFICLKDATGARATLKKVAPTPGSEQQKNKAPAPEPLKKWQLQLRNTFKKMMAAHLNIL